MATLLVLGVIILIVYRFQREVRQSYEYASRKAAPVRSAVMPVPAAYRDILQKYFSYYQRLNPELKRKFEKRVARFIYGKQFIPRQIDSVTPEARVLIAACAVQLTFGLPRDYLSHFNKILVYPNDYYSSITKRYHKGEVNPRFGIIVLSWQSFVNGYINTTDSKNLGLHEMAHALRLEQHIRSEDHPPFDDSVLERFDTYAHNVCADPSFASQTIFRPYACTNVHEFFSVAVENFFEQPDIFHQEMPELYHIMTQLLQQDPLRMFAQPEVNPRPADPLDFE